MGNIRENLNFCELKSLSHEEDKSNHTHGSITPINKVLIGYIGTDMSAEKKLSDVTSSKYT